MKMYGEKIQGPNVVTLILPRNGRDLEFRFQSVLDYSTFDKLVPDPIPRKKLMRGSKAPVPDLQDPGYLDQVKRKADLRYDYIFLESIRATPHLEWEQVKYDDPETWNKWKDELKEAGFNIREVNLMQEKALEANSLDEEKLEEARQRFFASQQDQQLQELFQKAEQENTQSGVPANGSISSHQGSETVGTS